MTRQGRRALLASVPALLAGPGCATIARLPPPPNEVALAAEPPLGISGTRVWLDGPAAPMLAIVREAERNAEAAGRAMGPRSFLALSGGGDNGAFGAGFLTGWTERGGRPEFDAVTGVSVGALIAPFAFLGTAHDPTLRELFTQVRPTDLVLFRQILLALLFNPALADTSPLYALIYRHADAALLAAIGREHARGRLLLVATVNLDLQRPAVWNMGAIAASGHPQALPLFRRILLASAAVPGAFPPVLIDSEHAGRRFQEMHVDGGAAVQVFLNPLGVPLRGGNPQRPGTVYVIRNGRMDAEPPGNAARGLFSVTARSAQTLLHFSAIGDVARIRLTAARDGLDFRLARIAPDFRAERRELFDMPYMRDLFEHGRRQGLRGEWLTEPPTVGEG